VILDYIDPMCSLSLSSIHIGLHALILLPNPDTLRFGFIHGKLFLAMQSWESYMSFIFMI
jgi:hypothetical protein